MKLVKHLYFIPPPVGGVSIYVKRLTKRLNDLGYPSGAYYNKITDSSIDFDNYTYYRGFSRKFFIRNLINLIKDTREYSIVHSHDVFDDSIFLWFLSVIKNKKIVITVHNAKSVTNFYKQPFVFRLFSKLLSRKHPIWIAVSPEAKKELLKLPLKFNNIVVLPAFIPDENNDNIPNLLPKKLINFINSYEKIIVFYAYRASINNIDVYGCLDALKMFSELSKKVNSKIGLVYCISDKKVDLRSLKIFTRENNIDSNIFWQIGSIDYMSKLWKKTNVYIRPTISDGDSIAVREALAMNVHVVASNVTTRPKKVLTYQRGDNIDFLSKVIMALNKKNENKNLNAENYEFFDKMLEIYQNLLISE